jgi:hypothetical protein
MPQTQHRNSHRRHVTRCSYASPCRRNETTPPQVDDTASADTTAPARPTLPKATACNPCPRAPTPHLTGASPDSRHNHAQPTPPTPPSTYCPRQRHGAAPVHDRLPPQPSTHLPNQHQQTAGNGGTFRYGHRDYYNPFNVYSSILSKKKAGLHRVRVDCGLFLTQIFFSQILSPWSP